MNKINKMLFALFIFLFCMVPLILYSLNSIVDPFLLQHIGSLISVKDANNVNFESIGLTDLPGFAIMLLIIEKITVIKLENLQFSIILGPLFILNYYVLSKELTGSIFNSLLLTLVVIFGFATPYYSIWPHGWGFSLYLLFLLIYYKILLNKKVNYIFLLILIFIATNYYSYTSEVWMIFLSILVNVSTLSFAYFKSNKSLHNSATYSILFVFLIIFLSFNQIAYNEYLPSINLHSIHWSIISLFALLSIGKTSVGPYNYVSQSPRLLFWINAVILILLTTPVFMTMLFDLTKLYKKTSSEYIKFLCFRWSATLVSIVDVLIYSALGIIFFRYIVFIFPLIAIVSLNIILPKKQKVITLFLSIIVILTIISFIWTWSLDIKNTSTSSYSEFNYGAKWLNINGINKKVISDHYTLSWYQIVFSKEKSKVDGYYYSDKTFSHLVDPVYAKYGNNYFRRYYVIINHKFGNHRTWANGWNDFKPINNYDKNIKNNINLHKVYSDGYISILDGTG